MAQVPPDFPSVGHEGALPGAQEKYAARHIDGKFVVGLTDDELRERFEECSNIVAQLAPLFLDELRRFPNFDEARHLTRLRNGIRAKRWAITSAEVDWMVEQVRAQTLTENGPKATS